MEKYVGYLIHRLFSRFQAADVQKIRNYLGILQKGVLFYGFLTGFWFVHVFDYKACLYQHIYPLAEGSGKPGHLKLWQRLVLFRQGAECPLT